MIANNTRLPGSLYQLGKKVSFLLCKICNTETTAFASAQVLKKYNIAYFRCPLCGFVQTEQPYWLAESYHSAIADEDTGLVNRNLLFAKLSASIIHSFFEPNKVFLDFGGGYGLFVRLMLDMKLNFYRYDKFCPNLFAKGFDGNLDSQTQYELITAFEVLEHSVYPLTDIELLLQSTRNILFSTEVIAMDPPKPSEWHYYALSSGQHISFFTLKSLYFIAKKYRLKFYTDERWVHIFSDKDIRHPHFKLVE
jgi:hypothetical protein